MNSDQYDQYLDEIVKQRFNIAEEVMEKFEKNLDVMKKNIIICCGNHDKVRYKNKEKERLNLLGNSWKSRKSYRTYRTLQSG